MRSFHIREFFDVPRDEWPCHDDELMKVTFDDGIEVVVNTPRLEFSAKLWDLPKKYTRVPINSNLYIGTGPVPYSRIKRIARDINKHLYDLYDPHEIDREVIWEILYRMNNKIYNEAIVEYAAWRVGYDSSDYEELYEHPPIAKIRSQLRKTSGSISEAIDKVTQILKKDESIADNIIIIDLRAGLCKLEQLIQIILVRGFNTDIDSYINDSPIMGNYYAGVHDPAEALMDSLLASKAILNQGAPLEQTEYANRKIQFSTTSIDLLVTGDCGTPLLMDVFLEPNNAEAFDGLWYKTDDGLKMYSYWEDDHLIGETLSFRVPHNCKHRSKGCICTTCYGALSSNIPYGTNVGHLASTRTMSTVSQLVLKTKHSESSVDIEAPSISAGEADYIRLPVDSRSKICLSYNLQNKNAVLVLDAIERNRIVAASRLPVLKRRHLDPEISTERFSQFKKVRFIVYNKDGTVENNPYVSVCRGTQSSHLSYEFLTWFLDKGFHVQDDDKYHIPLKDWDFSLPVFELPRKHMNMRDFATEVEVFIRSTRDETDKHLGKLPKFTDYRDDANGAALKLFELINNRIFVHFNHSSVVTASMMVKDIQNDFRLPDIDEPWIFEKYDAIVEGRSLAPLFAYQGGKKALLNINQYMNTKRNPHLYDPLVRPR